MGFKLQWVQKTTLTDASFLALEQLEDENHLEDDVFGDSETSTDAADDASPSWALTGESPFTWLPRRSTDVTISRVEERIQSHDMFLDVFPFEKLVSELQ